MKSSSILIHSKGMDKQVMKILKELLAPAIKGIINVLTAGKELGVQRVVLTSSISAIVPSPDWPADVVKSENCWTDVEYCKQKEICDPPVSVYKGYSMPKDKVKYLLSSRLKNALYFIRAADLTEELFGSLLPCPFQEAPESKSLSNDPRKNVKLDHLLEIESIISGPSCILEFDGASKGNPGRAGAGVVLRADDGSLICRLREGLGIATNNVAEYRAMILGLRCALEKGYTSIRVLGDSKPVCMQWRHWGSCLAPPRSVHFLGEEAACKLEAGAFLDLGRNKMEEISKAMTVPVEELVKRVEELTRLH